MIFLALAALSAGLFAGLMMTLVVIMQKLWKTMTRGEYSRSFKAFLVAAKGDRIVTALTLYSTAYPLIAGTAIAVRDGSAEGYATLAAGLVFGFGCLGVTLVLNFPIYRKVAAWLSEDDAGDWHSVRDRFFRLNLARLISSLASCALLLWTMAA